MSNTTTATIAYGFREGHRTGGLNAQEAGEELARICRERGGLRPAEVVEEASAVTSPLHPAFEWDDDVAAHHFRLVQARQLIRTIEIKPTDSTVAPRLVYVHVSAVDGYQPMMAVVARPEWFDLAREELTVKLRAARRALAELRTAAESGPKREERVAALERIGAGLDAAAEAAGELT